MVNTDVKGVYCLEVFKHNYNQLHKLDLELVFFQSTDDVAENSYGAFYLVPTLFPCFLDPPTPFLHVIHNENE